MHTSETILTNVRVLAIDQTVEEKDGQRVVVGKTATLELTPRQAETLARVAPARHAVARAAQPRRTATAKTADARRERQRPAQQHQYGSFRRQHDDDAEIRGTEGEPTMGSIRR